MKKKDTGNYVIRLAFLLGYAYALGYEYGRRNCLTMDDTESGKTQERNEKGEYTKEGGGNANQSSEKIPENKGLSPSKITPQEFDDLALKSAEPLRIVEYSQEAFERDFPDGKVKTPINEVKLGENQISKLFSKHRDSRFGFMKPTFERPTVIFREYDSPEKIEEYKRAGKTVLRDYRYCYVKAFKSNGGKRYFCNVSVLQDGDVEVSITSRDLRRNQVLNKMGLHEVVWKHGDGRASS